MAKKMKPGQKQCPKCGATVTGARTKTCPKCSHEFQGKQDVAPSKAEKPAKEPAKKQGVNKSQAVRDYLKKHRGAQNKEVAEALTKAGIPMKADYVANVKGNMKKRRKAVKKVVAKTGIGIPQIKAAFALLKECGGSAAAREALAAAEEIKAMV